ALAPAPAPSGSLKKPQVQHAASYFTPVPLHAAMRRRQHTHVDPRGISVIGQLGALVSASDRQFHTDSGALGGGASAGRQLPLACRYNPSGSRLAVVDEGGSLSLFDTARNVAMAVLRRWRAHDHAVFDGAWSPDGRSLLTAAADDTCRLWDAERATLCAEFRGHTKTVRAVDWLQPQCFASGARDGAVLLWDLRCNRTLAAGGTHVHCPVASILQAHAAGALLPLHRPQRSGAAGSVTGLRFLRHRDHLLASASAASAAVRLWDMRMVRGARPHAARPLAESSAETARGLASLALDPSGTRLFAPCNDGRVHVHDAQRIGSATVAELRAPEFECRGFGAGAAASGCGRYVGAGSASGAVVVWELDGVGGNSSRRRAVLRGHQRDAGCVAWHPQITQLASCADDGVVRMWDLDGQAAEDGRASVAGRSRWGFAEVC
ncbi:hypothetical protein LPJ66_007015, partial [Kickxella alabastrina]